jgi:hypothetical protein
MMEKIAGSEFGRTYHLGETEIIPSFGAKLSVKIMPDPYSPSSQGSSDSGSVQLRYGILLSPVISNPIKQKVDCIDDCEKEKPPEESPKEMGFLIYRYPVYYDIKFNGNGSQNNGGNGQQYPLEELIELGKTNILKQIEDSFNSKPSN